MNELLTLGRVRLVAGDGGALAASGAQPKRLALLAYIALGAASEPVRRDVLFALFWPDRDEEDGRRLLRQTLYYLRRALGDDVIVGNGDELSLRDGALECDAVSFERLVAIGRFDEALELYQGDFFDGLRVEDASPELDEWIGRTRARLRRRASMAAWFAAESAVHSDAARATALARRACDLEPDQESGWRRLMTFLEQLGDRDGALRTFDELAVRLQREYGAMPSPETRALAERIRRGASPPPAPRDAARPTAAAGADASLGATRPARRLRMRPALLAGLVGVIATAGAVSASLWLRDTHGKPSLVASGSLASRDRVVVADFQNLAGDSLLTGGITEAFRVDLAESPLVRVLSTRQVASALGRMELAPNAVLTDSLARKLAVREGAKAVVAGAVAKAAGAFTVSVQLVGAERGDVLAAFHETAADSTQLLAAVDRASKQLRHRIGESLRSLRALPPLAEETTASLAALRKYSEGQRLSLAGQRSAAIRLFEEAVAIDTAFASAYVSLGMSYAAVAEPGRSAAARRRAIAHQRRLPFYERSFAVASYAYNQGDYETATDWYTRVLERYPDDVRALNNLALVYRDRRRFAVAESLFTRATMIDSTIAALYFGVHDTQLLQGNFRGSRRTLDLIARRFPGNLVLLTVEIQDAAAQQHWEQAERQAETAIAAKRGDTLALVDPYEALAAITMTQGRLTEAERHWRTHDMLSTATDSRGRHLYGVMQVALMQHRHRRASARALALVDSALEAMPLAGMLPADRPYDELARFYASLGRLTRAREMLAAAAANDSVLERTPGADRLWTRGVIALAERRFPAAESDLRQAAEGTVCTICALPDLARAYEAAGKPEAAVVVYERYLTTPWFYRYETDGLELGWSLKRLAELYDARGESAKAAAMRGRLVQLWRRSDPELQSVVDEARRRLGS